MAAIVVAGALAVALAVALSRLKRAGAAAPRPTTDMPVAPAAAPPARTTTAVEPRFARAEAEYARLKKAFEAGQITADAFETSLSGQTFEFGGRYWMIGANTGKWYASQGDQWVEGTPPGR